MESRHVEGHGWTVKTGGRRRADGNNASTVQDDGAIFQRCAGVQMHSGMLEDRGHKGLVVGAIDGERGVRRLGT